MTKDNRTTIHPFITNDDDGITFSLVSIRHNERCIKTWNVYKEAVFDFFQRFPNHCRKCHGWGGTHSTYDPSPAGISLGAGHMEEFESCPECYDKGKCPRCGKQVIPLEKSLEGMGFEACPDCGWTAEGHGDTGGLPQPPECNCWNNK